jgi:hypothetical protein
MISSNNVLRPPRLASLASRIYAFILCHSGAQAEKVAEPLKGRHIRIPDGCEDGRERMVNLLLITMKKFNYTLGIVLVLMIVSGTGYVQEDISAIQKAAEKGDSYARHQLGEMYASGRGVQKDYVQAYMWMTLAASEIENFSVLEERERIANQMTLAQIVQARKLVINWTPPRH